MSTVEKLFVQIFERKNSIIEQVKQQTDLISQHLASKLLIDGITPPSWLWSHSQSSDPKELNKDELITEILLPRAWPSTYYSNAPYSICNRTVAAGNNGELPDGAFVETYASSMDLQAGEGPNSGAVFHKSNNVDAPNSIPQLDARVTILQDDIDTRTESTLDAPDQSLAKINRSKSRQKALELRNSASAKARSQSSIKYKSDVTSIGIDFSSSFSEQVTEPSMIVSGHRGLPSERNNPEHENWIDNYPGRVTRYRSSSIKKNCMSDYCKANSYSDIAENVMSNKKRHAVSMLPMLPIERENLFNKSPKIFEQENLVNKSPKISEPCMISTEIDAVSESSQGDNQKLGKGIDVYTGGVTRSDSSAKHWNCVHDSLEVNNSSGIDRKISSGQAHSNVGLLDHSVKVVNSSDITAETHDVCNTTVRGYSCQKENITDTYCGRTAKSMSSIQQCSIISETLYVDASSFSAKVTDNTVAQSSRETLDKLVDTKKQLESAQFSIELDNRSSMPQCHSGCEVVTTLGKISSIASESGSETKSASLQKSSCVNQYIQNAPHDNAILTGPEKCDADNQLANWVADASNSHIPQSSLGETNERKGLECLVAELPSDCFMLMKPKQLDFDDTEEVNLNGHSHCDSEDVNLDISNKGKSCTPLDCFSLRDKIPSSSPIIFSEKESILEQDSYSKVTRLSILPVEFTIQEPDRSKRCASDIKLHTSKSSLGDPAASNTPAEEDNMHSNTFNNSDAKHHHWKLSPREKSVSLTKSYLEVGVSGLELHDEGISASCASKSKNLVASCTTSLTDRTTGDHQMCLDKKVANEDRTTSSFAAGAQNYIQEPRCNDENFSLLELKETQISMDSSLLERKFRSARVNSWPQVKRRKLEDQTNCFSASRNSQMPKLFNIKMPPGSIDLHIIERQANTVSEEASCVDNITGELCPTMDHHAPEGLDMSLITSNNCMAEELGRGDLEGSTLNTDGCYTPHEQADIANILNDGVLQVSCKTKEAIDDFQNCIVEETEREVPAGPNFDACKHSDEQDFKSALNLENSIGLVNNEIISCTGGVVLKNNSDMVEDDIFPHSLVHSSHDEVESTGIHDTMPMFESFVIDPPEADRELDMSEVGINFEDLDLPKTTIERASILEQICRSASMQGPLSNLSSALKLHRSNILYQSLPKGLLEQRDLRSTSFFTEDIDEQFRSSTSCAEEARDSVQSISYSDCLGYSGAKFRWKSGSPYASPVGKLWERTSPHSGSSGKKLSSNPELTCFPIKEDPTISEENENVDKLADEVQDDIDSLAGNSDAERPPLFDITDACLNPFASVSAAEKKVHACVRMDSAKSDAGVSGKHNKAKRKLQSHCSNVSEGKENRALVICATGKKKEKQSYTNTSRKHKLSATTSGRKNEEKLSEKGHNKHNNIVSNVTSFIPLVHQKQAATVCTAKKDVKVKALEAAEAAKRVEEKKEIERKKRREAVKLERARLEQENLRQLELNKQKKEEERKKKAAEVLARKRLRAEEEKNGKEKKRKRVEELRRHHNEQEEKLCAKKVDIQKKCSTTVEKKTRDDNASNKSLSEHRHNSGATVSPDSLDTSGDQSQHEKMMIHGNLDKQDQNFTAKGAQLESYEISPYKCSDDEEEYEDDQAMEKPIPLWESCIARSLLSQQEIDPDIIFPPQSFCRMDEVLMPQKLQQLKRRAL